MTDEDQLIRLEQASELGDETAEKELWSLRKLRNIGKCFYCDIELGPWDNSGRGFNVTELILVAKDYIEKADSLGASGQFSIPAQLEALSIFLRYIAKGLIPGSCICHDCLTEWRHQELGEPTNTDLAPLASIWIPPSRDEII